jgi:hypothetical protein
MPGWSRLPEEGQSLGALCQLKLRHAGCGLDRRGLLWQHEGIRAVLATGGPYHAFKGRTFGAPRLTARTGYASRREQPGGAERPGDRAQAAGVAGGLAVAGRQLRSRPSDEGPADAAAAAHGFPAPAAAGPAVTSRMARHTSRPGCHSRARCANRRTKVTATGGGTPRIVRVGPSSLNGASRPRSVRTRLRRAVDPGADPAGLTARARPDRRAANLCRSAASPPGSASACGSCIIPAVQIY